MLHKIEFIVTKAEVESLESALQAILPDAIKSDVSKDFPTDLVTWLGRISLAKSDMEIEEKSLPFK